MLARVRVGVWERELDSPRTVPDKPAEVPTFHEYASQWLQRRVDGVLGDRPLSDNTRSDYLWRLTRPSAAVLRDAAARRDRRRAVPRVQGREDARVSRPSRGRIAAGADLRDERNRRRFPLGPASFRKLISMLAAILDDAIEDGHIERNPARTKRMRVRVPKPQRSFLEFDELRALMDAAPRRTRRPGACRPLPGAGETARQCRRMLTRRHEPGRDRRRAGAHEGDRSTGTPDACRSSALPTPAGRSSCASSATAAYATASCATSGSARSPARPRRRSVPHPRRQDRDRCARRRDEPRSRGGVRWPPRPNAPRRQPDRARRLRRAELARRSHQPPAHRGDHPRCSRRSPARPESSRVSRRCLGPLRTAFAARTSRSRCLPTVSM